MLKCNLVRSNLSPKTLWDEKRWQTRPGYSTFHNRKSSASTGRPHVTNRNQPWHLPKFTRLRILTYDNRIIIWSGARLFNHRLYSYLIRPIPPHEAIQNPVSRSSNLTNPTAQRSNFDIWRYTYRWTILHGALCTAKACCLLYLLSYNTRDTIPPSTWLLYQIFRNSVYWF